MKPEIKCFLDINEMSNDEIMEADEEGYRYSQYIKVEQLKKILDCLDMSMDDLDLGER